jgi:branched-chain amino acid transport system permease protein
MRRLGKRAAGVLCIALILFGFNYAHASYLMPYAQDIVLQCGIAIILAVSLNIVNGFTGQFSIGHAGFMAVGAYTGGSLSYLIWQSVKEGLQKANPGWSSEQVLNAFSTTYWWLLPTGMLISGLTASLFGYIVGVPSLRLRGDYLAIVTLGLGEIIRVLFENIKMIIPAAEFMGGSMGFFGIPKIAGFIAVYATAILVIVLTRNLKFSLHGLAYQSIREDEVASDAMGVNTTGVKITAFALGAFFAGMGGALYAHIYFFSPKSFNFMLSINYVVMIVLGGTGSITGATIAAAVLTVVPEALKAFKDYIPDFKDEYRMLIYALILILMMLLRPQGVFGMSELSLAGIRRRLFRRANEQPQRDTPSEIQNAPPPAAESARPSSEEIVRVEKCCKVFGGLTAVNNFDISLKKGELVGLIGPNGAGKTTVFNLLTGVYEPTTGCFRFDGKMMAGVRPYPPLHRFALLAMDTLLLGLSGWLVGYIMSTSIKANVTWAAVTIAVLLSLITAPKRRINRAGFRPYQFAERGIARTFQNIRLFPDLTVLQNVMIGSYIRRKTNLFDALFRTARMEREDAQIEARALSLLSRFGLDKSAHEKANSLPYGAQRRLEIARALATNPKLLLLDEPAAGMNPQEKQDLMEDILHIRQEFGLTILLIEHDMTVVMGICERIYVLDYGEIIAEGTPEEIRRDPKVIAAYLGEEIATTDKRDRSTDIRAKQSMEGA